MRRSHVAVATIDAVDQRMCASGWRAFPLKWRHTATAMPKYLFEGLPAVMVAQPLSVQGDKGTREGEGAPLGRVVASALRDSPNIYLNT